ncbi:hypothetical protein ILYODFUR_034195, partial [Ilyodon furcidens]
GNNDKLMYVESFKLCAPLLYMLNIYISIYNDTYWMLSERKGGVKGEPSLVGHTATFLALASYLMQQFYVEHRPNLTGFSAVLFLACLPVTMQISYVSSVDRL